jgi:hypothetical protein
MKKRTKTLLTAGLLLLCLGLLLAIVGIAAGASPKALIQNGRWDWMFFSIDSDDSYDNDFDPSGSYTIDDASVHRLSLDWVDGDITILACDDEVISLEESASTALTEDNCLRYRVSSGTLEIRSQRSGGRAGISFSGTHSARKSLVLKLPQALAAELTDISLDVVGSNVTIKGVSATSAQMDTVSGSLYWETSRCPDTLDFESVSGNCQLLLPKTSGFALELDTVSGKVNLTDFNYSRDEKDEDEETFVVGDGSCKLQFDTVSGNVRIAAGDAKADA